jgi:uncharacterized tellurite resistance protein B-like protein
MRESETARLSAPFSSRPTISTVRRLDRLLEAARDADNEAVDLYQFTSC